MDEKNEENKEITEEVPENKTKIYFYVGLAACVLSAVFFGLTFSPLGLYALIASVILSLCSLSFIQTQKKKNEFKGNFYLKIAAYAVLAAEILLFVGGLIYSAAAA